MAAAVTGEAQLGKPVEIGRIDRELGRLWEEAGESKTRASLLNLVIYSEDADALDRNTRILSEIAGRHACRAILIFAEPGAPGDSARAWINAHCQLVGSRQICSEQITFHLEGAAARAVPSIVFSHLDSDLPLCFWWQGAPRGPVEAGFWAWVDRLIYDSAAWEHPAEPLAVVREVGALSNARIALGDLNWARLSGIQLAVAGLFDHASALRQLRRIERIEIGHAPGFRMTALLLLGWFGARLGWTPAGEGPGLRREDGREVVCALSEIPGAPVGRCVFSNAAAECMVERHGESFVAAVRGGGCEAAPRAFGIPREGTVDLLLSELATGGHHGNYRDALAIAAHWL